MLASLNETEMTLSDVVSHLGFRKLKRSDEGSLRENLSFAIGQWRMSGSSGTEPRISLEELAKVLSRIGTELKETSRVLSAVHGGFQHDLDIEVTSHIAQALAQSAGRRSISEGYDAIEIFLEHAAPIAESASTAAKQLQAIRGRQGRDRQGWYTKFIDVVASVCAFNQIKPTLSTDRKTDASSGRFLEAIEAFEVLLPKHMRAPSRTARVQRLRRWRRPRIRVSKN